VLRWSANSQPSVVTFSDAPTGVYSKTALSVDGHLVDDSVRIQGEVSSQSGTEDFDIVDRGEYSILLAIDKALQPGGMVAVGLRVGLGAVVGDIDWSNVTLHDDGYRLEGPDALDPEVTAFESRLINSIRVDDSAAEGL